MRSVAPSCFSALLSTTLFANAAANDQPVLEEEVIQTSPVAVAYEEFPASNLVSGSRTRSDSFSTKIYAEAGTGLIQEDFFGSQEFGTGVVGVTSNLKTDIGQFSLDVEHGEDAPSFIEQGVDPSTQVSFAFTPSTLGRFGVSFSGGRGHIETALLDNNPNYITDGSLYRTLHGLTLRDRHFVSVTGYARLSDHWTFSVSVAGSKPRGGRRLDSEFQAGADILEFNGFEGLRFNEGQFNQDLDEALRIYDRFLDTPLPDLSGIETRFGDAEVALRNRIEERDFSGALDLLEELVDTRPDLSDDVARYRRAFDTARESIETLPTVGAVQNLVAATNDQEDGPLFLLYLANRFDVVEDIAERLNQVDTNALIVTPLIREVESFKPGEAINTEQLLADARDSVLNSAESIQFEERTGIPVSRLIDPIEEFLRFTLNDSISSAGVTRDQILARLNSDEVQNFKAGDQLQENVDEILRRHASTIVKAIDKNVGFLATELRSVQDRSSKISSHIMLSLLYETDTVRWQNWAEYHRIRSGSPLTEDEERFIASSQLTVDSDQSRWGYRARALAGTLEQSFGLQDLSTQYLFLFDNELHYQITEEVSIFGRGGIMHGTIPGQVALGGIGAEMRWEYRNFDIDARAEWGQNVRWNGVSADALEIEGFVDEFTSDDEANISVRFSYELP